MPVISLIAAIDEANGLGINNQLLAHIPADLRHFKEITFGKPIIMGRKTYDSIGKPLPGRKNIVLSHNQLVIPGVIVVQSIEEALKEAQDTKEIMIIGGSGLFEQTLPIADKLYITRIHHQFEADTFFPYIDTELWQATEQRVKTKDDSTPYDLSFQVYERKKNPS